jgi:two-component system, OmpR family, response regulator
MATILVVDDDPHIRELVSHFMTQTGHAVVEAGDGIAALERVASGGIDLAVLDVMMPRLDGWQACKRIKAAHPEMPVLLLTARGETSQKVRGFDLGADDYLVKPFEPAELVVRVRALLRRFSSDGDAPLRVGRLVIDVKGWNVASGDATLTLPRKEFELLAALAAQPGRTFTRDGLLSSIWGDEFDGTERTVDVHVNRLRDRFPPESSGLRIETVRGLGYRLVEEE